MSILGFIVLIGVVIFAFFEVKGLIRDVKARKRKKQENVKNKEAESVKESDVSNEK